MGEGSGFRVQGVGLGVYGSGCRVWGLGCRVWAMPETSARFPRKSRTSRAGGRERGEPCTPEDPESSSRRTARRVGGAARTERERVACLGFRV